MFNLVVAIVVAGSVLWSGARNEPLPSAKAGEAQFEQDKANFFRPLVEKRLPGVEDVTIMHDCQEVREETKDEAADRAADEILRILRLMNKQGGIAAAGR